MHPIRGCRVRIEDIEDAQDVRDCAICERVQQRASVQERAKMEERAAVQEACKRVAIIPCTVPYAHVQAPVTQASLAIAGLIFRITCTFPSK